MKTQIFAILMLVFLINGGTFAQKGDLVLSFIGKDALTNESVPLESIYIENLTQGCDTTLFGASPFLYLSWPSGIEDNIIGKYEPFLLEPNYPNPFSSTTKFNIYINGTENLTIILYDINGSKVSEFEKELNYGKHTFETGTENNNLHILTVSNGVRTKSLKLLSRSTGINPYQGIRYLGVENNEGYKSTAEITNFVFQPGDQLLLKASAAGYNDNTLFDDPSENTDYIFELQSETIVTVPTVTTFVITDITQTSATSGGDVIDDGGTSVTAKGVCWSTSQNPTTDDNYTVDGNGTGIFTSYLIGLFENTTYYVRAYATNEVGAAYGNELLFNTLQVANVTGYVYYSGTTIPISGVNVSINGINYTTGTEGFYELIDIPLGNQTISANKPDFDPFNQAINIPAVGIEYIIEMTSGIYTHNIFGTILNQLGDPVSDVGVVVMNPDGTGSSLATTSASTGYYQIPTVPQGQRTIQFNKEICEPYEIIIFMANSNYQLDIELLEYGLPCPGDPTVEYEGQIYNTVLMSSNQCWFKENLNVGLMIPGTEDQDDNTIIEKYCLYNNPDYCDTYGGLYHWDEAMNYTTLEQAQGICPPGWHIPSDEEWKILEGTVDSQYPVDDSEWDGIQWRGFDAGENLKSEIGWNSGGNGTDFFGFSALPAGQAIYYNNFYGKGDYTYFWTSTYYTVSSHGWLRKLEKDYSEVYRYHTSKGYGRSVRCIRD